MMAFQSPRHGKTHKKQVAMIAQKVVDAKQPQWKWCPLIPSPYSRTTALGTLSQNHNQLPCSPFIGLSLGLLLFSPSVDLSLVRSFAISRSILSVPAARMSSFTAS